MDIFKNLKVTETEMLITRPYKDEDENVFYWCQNLLTLPDGKKVEQCLWDDSEYNMSFWDVSISKEAFNPDELGTFEKYMERMGLNIGTDSHGIVSDGYNKWEYEGDVPCRDVYRIQYMKID